MKSSDLVPKGKILIAEDDESMRRFLEVTLKRGNFETISACDGLEALDIALNFDIVAIVTDAVMPNMTGYDLCRVLRESSAKQHIPIILISGFDEKDEPEDCPADAYLTKTPDLNADLTKTLARLLRTDN